MRVCTLLLLVSVVCLAGCTSTVLRIPSAPVGPDEVATGAAAGSSTGIMLFQFIPINQNRRFEKAYADACKKAGADRLTDIEIQERWFWAYILNGYSFRVRGTGVKSR